MSLRKTDTEKWKNPWFRKLSPKVKLLWMYMLDNCDPAGIWKEDMEVVSILVGAPITQADLAELTGKVLRLNQDTLFIPGFVKFQSGDEQLNGSGNNYHKGVLKRFKDARIDPVTFAPSSFKMLVPSPDPAPDPGPDLDSDPNPKPLGRGFGGASEGLEREPKGTGTGTGTGKFLNSQNEENTQVSARARDKGEAETLAIDSEPAQDLASNVYQGPWTVPETEPYRAPDPQSPTPARVIAPITAKASSGRPAPPGVARAIHDTRGAFRGYDYGPPASQMPRGLFTQFHRDSPVAQPQEASA